MTKHSLSQGLMTKFGAAFVLLAVPIACNADSGGDEGGGEDEGEAEEGEEEGDASEGGSSSSGGSAEEGTATGDGSTSGDGEDPVDLGAAEDFVILAKTGISTVPTSAITGDLGISPADATYITGFSLTLDASNEFSTSIQVTGKIHAADYAPPTPSVLTTAISDMELAFVDAAGRAADVTELGAGDIGGMTLEPGVYKWSSAVSIPEDLTLDGGATDVWIFQIAENLTVGPSISVSLSGGAVPEHVFWQVAGIVDVGTTAHLEGIVLTQTAVTLATGATIQGRLLAQTAVDMDGNTVVEP